MAANCVAEPSAQISSLRLEAAETPQSARRQLPVATFACPFAARPRHCSSGQQLANPSEEGLWPRHKPGGQILRQNVLVQLRPYGTCRQNCLDFGREQQLPFSNGVIKRLDAETIARQQ